MAEARSYRIYVTDILKASAEQKTFASRWIDLIEPSEPFDAESVVESVVSRGGLVVKE